MDMVNKEMLLFPNHQAYVDLVSRIIELDYSCKVISNKFSVTRHIVFVDNIVLNCLAL